VQKHHYHCPLYDQYRQILLSVILHYGDIDHIKGSDNDVFALAEKNSSGRYYITGAKGSAYQKEAVELTRILKDRAVYEETDETEADFSCITTMKKAVAWLCGR
jgi:heptaprenylglyceryl phosphate synthase